MRFSQFFLPIIVLCSAFVFSPAQAVIITKASTDVPRAIPDNTGGVAVSGLGFEDFNGYVASVRFSCNITHTFRGDLSAILIAPHGESYAVIQTDPNDGTDNVVISDLVLPDSSSMTASGVWQLRVLDNRSGETGTINSWSISVDSVSSPADADGTFMARYLPPVYFATQPVGAKQPLTIGFFESAGHYAGVGCFTRLRNGSIGDIKTLTVGSTAFTSGLDIYFDQAGYPARVYAQGMAVRVFRLGGGRGRIVGTHTGGTGRARRVNRVVPNYLATFDPARNELKGLLGVVRNTDYRYTDRVRVPTVLAISGMGRVGHVVAKLLSAAIIQGGDPTAAQQIVAAGTAFNFADVTASLSLSTQHTGLCRQIENGDGLSSGEWNGSMGLASAKTNIPGFALAAWYRIKGRVMGPLLSANCNRLRENYESQHGTAPGLRTVGEDAQGLLTASRLTIWLQPDATYLAAASLRVPSNSTAASVRVRDFNGLLLQDTYALSGSANVNLPAGRGYLIIANEFTGPPAPVTHSVEPLEISVSNRSIPAFQPLEYGVIGNTSNPGSSGSGYTYGGSYNQGYTSGIVIMGAGTLTLNYSGSTVTGATLGIQALYGIESLATLETIIVNINGSHIHANAVFSIREENLGRIRLPEGMTMEEFLAAHPGIVVIPAGTP